MNTYNIDEIFDFYKTLASNLDDKRFVQISSANESFPYFFVAGLLQNISGKQIIVLPTTKECLQWYAHLHELTNNMNPEVLIDMCPHYSCWGDERYMNHAQAHKQRLSSLANLVQHTKRGIIVTTLAGIAQLTISAKSFKDYCFGLSVGQDYDLDELLRKIELIGYQKCSIVESSLCWANRGGILDIFPSNSNVPMRLEFLGDTLVSIRTYDIDTQISKSEVKEIQLIPASECIIDKNHVSVDSQKFYDELLNIDMAQNDRNGMLNSFNHGVRFSGFDMFYPIFNQNAVSLFDYFSKNFHFVFPKSIQTCVDAWSRIYDGFCESYESDITSKKPSLAVERHFEHYSDVIVKLENLKKIEFANPQNIDGISRFVFTNKQVFKNMPMPEVDRFKRVDGWLKFIEKNKEKDEITLCLVCSQQENIEKLIDLLKRRKIEYEFVDNIFQLFFSKNFLPSRIIVGRGYIPATLPLLSNQIIFVSDEDIFGSVPKKTKAANKQLKDYLNSFQDLKINDYVVHVTHGIGQYLGLTTLELGGVTGDFLIIQYSGNDKIYLPVDKLDLLQKYAANSGSFTKVHIDKLNSGSWIKKKTKVAKAVKDIADDLLKLQAKRQLSRVQVYGSKSDTYENFEADFPYEETEDQLRALSDIELDFLSEKAMDRLVIGDVGFGKTEVAIRAVMRVVLEGFRAIVLVPTTVLCYQHYHTFFNRLAKYGVHVAQLNRFVKGKKLKATLDEIKTGKIDVLVGTHRLLSKDVKVDRLGLLVVDEEQRFGVTHKERIKELRASADVLTLSATPIPRTLHMAMLGLRDISVIATPPYDRLAVKTFVAKFDEALIKEMIERELNRGGQVFFVHNRVENIFEVCAFLKELVPHAEIRVGHGQMTETELEDTILDFLEQKFSILVCTTIIESGIDMPNVNTIFVNRADQFGLAQLYQLRGRVGRSASQGFAYFLTPKGELISDEAKRRLDVLITYQDLGSGFQIATHDLDLRGAGNLLGSEQSGHIASVGLEMYTEMLDETIRKMRGEDVEERHDIEIKLSVSALIPISYITNESERLTLYKALFTSHTDESIENIKKHATDRFGVIPIEFVRLLEVAKIRVRLKEINAVALMAGRSGLFEITFGSLKAHNILKLQDIVDQYPLLFRLTPEYRIVLSIKASVNPTIEQQSLLLTEILEILDVLTQGMRGGSL